MEVYSLKIEYLLCKLSPRMSGMRAVIAENPYDEIYNVLNGRVPVNTLEGFAVHYQGISGKSIVDLQSENYDIEKLISDLAKIVDEIKE